MRAVSFKPGSSRIRIMPRSWRATRRGSREKKARGRGRIAAGVLGAFERGMQGNMVNGLGRVCPWSQDCCRVAPGCRFNSAHGRTRALPAGRTKASVPTLALGFAFAGLPKGADSCGVFVTQRHTTVLLLARSERSQNPHPFDFAQGRLCRKMRDKDGAPSGLLSAQDLFLADSFRYARTSSA